MENLLSSIYQYPSLKEEDLQLLISKHQLIEIKKGSYLLKKGQTAKHYYIVVSGLLRSYVIDAHGAEITTAFFAPREVAIEVASIFTQQPTQEHIHAVSDCILYQISYEEFQEAFLTIPAVAEWGRMWMTFSLTQQKERMLNMLTQTAQDRYIQLMTHQPQVIQTVPLKYIASYLGITDTSLSRIRKELTK